MCPVHQTHATVRRADADLIACRAVRRPCVRLGRAPATAPPPAAAPGRRAAPLRPGVSLSIEILISSLNRIYLTERIPNARWPQKLPRARCVVLAPTLTSLAAIVLTWLLHSTTRRLYAVRYTRARCAPTPPPPLSLV